MEECLFCKIISGDIPSEKVYEDEKVLAFLDINPRNPGHALVVPKKHYQTILEMPDEELGNIFIIVKKIAKAVKTGMKADGISIGQSNERAAGQVIPHVHFHVIPRFNAEGPPGLESILPVKKLPQDTMKKTAEIVKNSMGGIPTSETGKSSPSFSSSKEKDMFDF
jgi:histidine triad (HIT) family protein